MSKFLKFALLTLALQPLPALAQVVTEYGFPISETSAGDLPCHMVTDKGNTLDLAKLCGGTPQARVTPQNQAGLVLSNISFRSPTQAEREVRGWALKIDGTLTNRSNQPIRARMIDYTISAFNGRYSEVLVKNSEYLSRDYKVITLAPGESRQFTHTLNQEQRGSLSGYMLAPDIFKFQVTGTSTRIDQEKDAVSQDD